MITVYTKPSCHLCEATKRELSIRGVNYSSVDITEDETAFDKIKSLGYRSMPVVITENDHWAGFRVDKLFAL